MILSRNVIYFLPTPTSANLVIFIRTYNKMFKQFRNRGVSVLLDGIYQCSWIIKKQCFLALAYHQLVPILTNSAQRISTMPILQQALKRQHTSSHCKNHVYPCLPEHPVFRRALQGKWISRRASEWSTACLAHDGGKGSSSVQVQWWPGQPSRWGHSSWCFQGSPPEVGNR